MTDIISREVPIPSGEQVPAPETPAQKDFIAMLPVAKTAVPEVPKVEHEENVVTIGGQRIEIKPTKFKYFRNKTASIYAILKMIPLGEFLAFEKGTFDKDRDSDQILFDFLIAVFDDPVIVKTNYDNLDAEVFEQILKIFGRINHIDEKEEAKRKNLEAQAKH